MSQRRSQNHFSLLTIGIEFLKPIHLKFLPQPLSRNESGQDLEGMNNKGHTTTLTNKMVEWFVVFKNSHLTGIISSWEFSHQVVIIIDENFPKTELDLFIVNTKIIQTYKIQLDKIEQQFSHL